MFDDARVPGYTLALVLGLVLLSERPGVAQTAGALPSALSSADTAAPGTGVILEGPVGATPAGPGTDTGSSISAGESGVSATGSGRSLPRPNTGGRPCAPPGSAAAFAGTSQPGLCAAASARGGGAPGAGFSGGSAASATDQLVDPLFGAGGR